MSVYKCARPLYHLKKSIFRPQSRSGYIVLLPELGLKDTEKFKYTVNESLPNFQNLTMESCANIIESVCLEFDQKLKSLEKEVKGKEVVDVFKDVLDPIETFTIPLESAWGVLKVLFTIDQETVPPAFFKALNKKISQTRFHKFNNTIFYSLCKDCDLSKLSEEQVRLVQKYLLEGRLNGLELAINKDSRMTELIAEVTKINKEQNLFALRFEKALEQYSHVINDPNLVREFPKEVLETMVEEGDPSKGPWKITLSDRLRSSFLEFCPDRDLRWSFWQAEEKAGSNLEDDTSLRNSQSLEIIRRARETVAKLLGYPTYFHLSLETKMAGSLEEVQNTLDTLLEKAKPQQDMEVDHLQAFASACGFQHPVQLWDVPYWARLQKKALLNFDAYEQRVYFPLPTVLEGLFELCSKLFHISFKEVTKGIEKWHPDVKFYNVFRDEDTKPIGSFYIDLCKRDKKLFYGHDYGYEVAIRNHSLISGKTLPLSAIIFNFPPAEGNIPPLLTFFGVQQLFYKFGPILQNILCEAAYSDVSGVSNLEWDSVEAVSHFLTLWLYDEKVFNSINGHYKTGEKLNLPLKSLQQYMTGFKLCHEIFKSNLDIELHSTNVFWVEIMKKLWPDHYSFPLAKWNSYPCQFVDSASGQWGAGYYSHVWSQMLAADVFSAFSEEKQDVESTGLRFRDTFLAFGGSCHSSETFRRFRGRDPSPTALLKQLGLTV